MKKNSKKNNKKMKKTRKKGTICGCKSNSHVFDWSVGGVGPGYENLCE